MKSFLVRLLLISVFYQSHLAIAQSPTQTVRGQVSDIHTKETLVGASVILLDTGIVKGTTTDAKGNFRIEKVSIGRHKLRITFIGYHELIIPVEVTSGKEIVLNIELEESIIESKEVVVTGTRDKDKPSNELATVSARSFTTEETSRYAGSLLDPARMAMNYAGVSGSNDARNDIIIRGNSPLGLLWRLDGIEIPNPNHFGSVGVTGGPISILNNNTLDKSDFFTGAFPAEYGNALAGAFDLQMRTGNNEKHEFLAQLGFNGLEFGAEGPVKKESSSYMIYYRYSTLKIFDALHIDLGAGNSQPNYQDITFNLNFPTKKGRITFFGIGGISSATILDQNRDTTKENIYDNNLRQNGYFDTNMGIVGLQQLIIPNDNSYIKMTVSASTIGQKYIVDSIGTTDLSINPWYRNNTNQQKYAFNFLYNKKFSSHNFIKAGVITDLIVFLYTDSVLREQSYFQTITNSNGNSLLMQGYVQWQHKFSDKLSVTPGFHSQYFALNNSFTLEPRIGLKWILKRNQTLGFGTGIYSQLQPMYAYFQETTLPNNNLTKTNTNLAMSSSAHFVLAYDKVYVKNLRLKLEAYYQYLYNIPIEQSPSSYSVLNDGADFVLSAADSLVNKGTGKNFGVEVTFEKFLSHGYYFLITGSFFESKYKGSDHIERNTAFNGNYTVNFLAGKEWTINKKNVFEFDFRTVASGGKRYVPVNLEASEQAGYEVKDYNHAYEQRQKDYFRMDVKIAYRINLKKTTHELALNVDNITNRKNIWQQYYDPYSNSIKTEYQIGIFPVPLYRLTF